MGELSPGSGAGREKIGRQIVLPLSKAFEIAWGGIRIRIWRSLITMSGIILAIAFLMSVWAAGVFDRTLRSVDPNHELFPLVQSALEAEAIASGGVRIRCAVLESEEEVAEGAVAPGASIRHFLNAEEAFRSTKLAAEPRVIVETLGLEAEEQPDALILAGPNPVLLDSQVSAAIRTFVAEGGFLLAYGAMGPREGLPLADVLPAQLGEGTFTVAAGDVRTGQEGIAARWQEHPSGEFLETVGRPDAVMLASAGGRAVVWSRPLAEGLVAWYPVAGASAGDPDVISWFVRGQTTGVEGRAGRAATSLMARLLVRGAHEEEEGRDMRGVWLVTLSLMVCVVGITNAMLMSVTERFREIGTMKCLGALDKFVVKLFLIESSLQGVFGSLLGALIGFVLAFVRALFTYHVEHLETGQSYWLVLRFFPALELLGWVAIALVVGVVLSVVAAIYPAIRAARMEPVQAMRVEA